MIITDVLKVPSQQHIQYTLKRIKTVWQSKKVSKSVGHIFNKFNAFWVLFYVSYLIFSPTFYLLLLEMTLEGVSFWTFYMHKSVEIVIRESFSTEKNGQFSTDIKSGREY